MLQIPKYLLILSFLAVQIASQDKVRYDSYQVYRVTPKTSEALATLKTLESHYRFWSEISTVNQHVDIMVDPNQREDFEKLVERTGFESKIFVQNVQLLIDNERPKVKAAEEFGWTDYYDLEEIYNWMFSLAEKYPEIVSIENGGTSYEGRPILGLYVSYSPDNRNRSVFLESNIHACEWIGSAVSTYILDQILTSADPEVRNIAESHDWFLFPVINPDGFVYTHTTDRIWRKTRVPHGNGDCVGADPNRNWGYHFNDGGASDDPCSEHYAGPSAFSEPEMRSLANYITTIGNNLEAYFSFHSYAQIMLLPYGYTTDHLDNYDELHEVGLKSLDVLSQRYGTEYQIGNVAEIMYIASGGSPDWIKGVFGTRITYTFELRDTGEYGFLLPAELIIPTAEETFDSIITIFKEFAKTV